MVTRTKTRVPRSPAETTKGRHQHQPQGKGRMGAANTAHGSLRPIGEENRLPKERSKRASNREAREETEVNKGQQRNKSGKGGLTKRNHCTRPDRTREDHNRMGRSHLATASPHLPNGQQSKMHNQHHGSSWRDHGITRAPSPAKKPSRTSSPAKKANRPSSSAKKPSQRHPSNALQERDARGASPTKTRSPRRHVPQAPSPSRGHNPDRIVNDARPTQRQSPSRAARQTSPSRGRSPSRATHQASPARRGQSHDLTSRQASPTRNHSPKRSGRQASAARAGSPKRAVLQATSGNAKKSGTMGRLGAQASIKTKKRRNTLKTGADTTQTSTLEQRARRNQVLPASAKKSSSNGKRSMEKTQAQESKRASQAPQKDTTKGDVDLIVASRPEKTNKKISPKSKKEDKKKGWMRNLFRKGKQDIASPETQVPLHESRSLDKHVKAQPRELVVKPRAKSFSFDDEISQLSTDTDDEVEQHRGIMSEFLPSWNSMHDAGSLFNLCSDSTFNATDKCIRDSGEDEVVDSASPFVDDDGGMKESAKPSTSMVEEEGFELTVLFDSVDSNRLNATGGDKSPKVDYARQIEKEPETDNKAQDTEGHNGVVGSIESAATTFYTNVDKVLDMVDPTKHTCQCSDGGNYNE